MPLAPKPFSAPRARNPTEAKQLYDHKLSKRYPFHVARAYDWEAMEDFRAYGRMVRQDNLPQVDGITFDNQYFWLHTQSVLHGCTSYTFIHLLTENGTTQFRPLLFDCFSAAYRYAHAYGCQVNKRPLYIASILDFMAEAMDDVDMFIDCISIKGAIRDMRPKGKIISLLHAEYKVGSGEKLSAQDAGFLKKKDSTE